MKNILKYQISTTSFYIFLSVVFTFIIALKFPVRENISLYLWKEIIIHAVGTVVVLFCLFASFNFFSYKKIFFLILFGFTTSYAFSLINLLEFIFDINKSFYDPILLVIYIFLPVGFICLIVGFAWYSYLVRKKNKDLIRVNKNLNNTANIIKEKEQQLIKTSKELEEKNIKLVETLQEIYDQRAEIEKNN